MIIYGEGYSKKNKTRIDDFKRCGILTQTSDTGSYMLSPLGKLMEDSLLNKIVLELKRCEIPEMEIPSIVRLKNEDQCYKGCRILESRNLDLFVCDPLYDVEEVACYIKYYPCIYWIKQYIDTSKRMCPTKLKFHSYKLLCILSNESVDFLCKFVYRVICKGLGLKNNMLVIRKNDNNDFSIRFDKSDNFTIAHIHSVDSNGMSICGISIERLILLILKYNQIERNSRIIIFKKVLVAYKNLSDDTIESVSKKYDFIDSRNIKISQKRNILLDIGVEEIDILLNSSIIKKLE